MMQNGTLCGIDQSHWHHFFNKEKKNVNYCFIARKNRLYIDNVKQFYTIIQSQITMHGMFVDFYNKCLKSYTNYDF